MATTKQYWLMLRMMSRTVSVKFGVDLKEADQNTRALVAIVGAMFAMLLKLLVDKGVITDDDIQAAWVDARDNNQWDPEPAQPERAHPPVGGSEN